MNQENKHTVSRLVFSRLSALVFSGVVLILILVLCAGFSFGWFAANSKVYAFGVKVKARFPNNLIVSGTSSDVTGIMTPEDMISEYSATSSSTSISPAERSNGYASGLRVLTNPECIDPVTGKVKSGETPLYRNAVSGTEYIDFNFYVGTAGSDFLATNLVCNWDTDNMFFPCSDGAKAEAGTTYYSKSGNAFSEVPSSSVTAGTTDVSNYFVHSPVSDTHCAISADFYVDGSYVGTLSVTDLTGTVSFLINGTISTDDPLHVTVRFYFDGAKTNSSGKTYLRSSNLNIKQVSLGFELSAE